MEALAKLMVAGLELVEAEGRLLKQQILRLCIGIALGIIVTLALITGLAFLICGLFLFLAENRGLGYAGAATVFGVASIVAGLVGAFIVKMIVLPAKPKSHKERAKEAQKKDPVERQEDIAKEVDEATERAQAHADRVAEHGYARSN
jgi:hypothetical protein